MLEVAEKVVISDQATVGIYYFRHGSDFVRFAKQMIAKDIRVNGEFYVCPVFNELVQAGLDVYISEIEPGQMHGLGTPEDLEAFTAWRSAAPLARWRRRADVSTIDASILRRRAATRRSMRAQLDALAAAAPRPSGTSSWSSRTARSTGSARARRAVRRRIHARRAPAAAPRSRSRRRSRAARSASRSRRSRVPRPASSSRSSRPCAPAPGSPRRCSRRAAATCTATAPRPTGASGRSREGEGDPDALALDCLAAPRELLDLGPAGVRRGRGPLRAARRARGRARSPSCPTRACRRRSIGPPASVIVCTQDRPDEIVPCAEALLAAGADEIVVVDNGSGAPLGLPDGVKLVREPVAGLSRARNTGAEAATHDVLVYLDDDARPAPGWLEHLRDAFADDAVMVAGGPIHGLWPRERTPGWPQAPWTNYFSILSHGDADQTWPRGDFYGANWAVRRSALDEVGGFEHRWGASGDGLLAGEETAVEQLDRRARARRRALLRRRRRRPSHRPRPLRRGLARAPRLPPRARDAVDRGRLRRASAASSPSGSPATRSSG